MSINSNKIDDLKESFNDLLQRNYEAQEDVNTAIRLKNYLKAVKAIDNFVQFVEEFEIKTLNMAQQFKEKADNENASICNKILRMANHIKTAHLEVEENILRKYRKK